ncbi:MAG TPA: chemotaxis protein CheX [Clostridia bacterium]|nr:chemotaxis protein CheX [Clostridia bacterium]
MRMELIQPFINSADAVLADMLKCSTKIADMSMEEEGYRRKGTAAVVGVSGDIEGRVIFDMEGPTAAKVASCLAGADVQETDEIVRETVAELANLVIGNAVTSLNDQGFRFKIHPPEVHAAEEGLKSTEDTEALVMCFDTPIGSVYMNIAMRYNRRRRNDSAAAM